ncbi:hypothetical protein [Paraburkholderia sp.]|uniref:hypothetical protein n=1 Tax=Paraburkholderia sp. TaxID=1926495 RepID=UPI002F42323C
MEQLTFGACVKKSWSSAWQAIMQMPGLFLGMCIVYACSTLLSDSLHPASPGAGQIDAAARTGHVLVKVLLALLQFVAYAVLNIKVYRFVLLGERAFPLIPLGGQPLGRYVAFSFGIALGMLVLMMPAVLFIRPLLLIGVLIGAVMLIVCMFVMGRLSLLYPSIALGSPIALRAAWRDTRGHFWSLFSVWLIAYMPLMLVWIVLTAALGGPKMLAASMQGTPLIAVGMVLINAVCTVLTSSSLAWLYRRYANALLDQVWH